MSSHLHRLALSCSTLFVACTDVADDATAPSIDDQSEPALTDTIVTVHVDGTLEQVTHSITAEAPHAGTDPATERGASQAERATATPTTPRSSALPVSSACLGADLWLYDSNLANRLCISGIGLLFGRADSIDLRTINYGTLCEAIDITGRCTQRAKWAGRVHYIRPGGNDGRLYLDPQASPTAVFVRSGPFRAVDPAQTVVVTLVGPP